MAQTAGLFTPFRYDVDSPAFVVIFYGSGAITQTFPIPFEAKNAQSSKSIVLPNGSKYDPHQTYQSPQSPGIIKTGVKILPAAGAVLVAVENEIGSNFDNSSRNVGVRGTLTAAATYGTQYTCTARLIEVELRQYHDYPRQIPAAAGGAGFATPGMLGGDLLYTFDQITNWEEV